MGALYILRAFTLRQEDTISGLLRVLCSFPRVYVQKSRRMP